MFGRAATVAARRAAAVAGAASVSGFASGDAPLALPTTTASYPANHPIEDRHLVFSMGDNVHAASVFDGHGGWQCSEFAMKNLESAMAAERVNSSADPGESPEELGRLLARAYGRLDRDFAAAVRPAFQLGFERVARTGSCALTVAVTPSHIVVANAGDCRAVLATAAGAGDASRAVALSRDHNARMPAERARLEAEHPGEADIVLCKSETACYVKGRLQPTRSLGDLYLKLHEFNGVPGDRARGRFLAPPATPPYISAEPEVHVRERAAGDRFVVLATDGLWDAMSSAEAVAFVDSLLRPESGPAVPREEVARRVVKEALRREAAAARIGMARLLALPAGRSRRGLHDDITVVVAFLDGEGVQQSAASAGGEGGFFGWVSSLFGGRA